MMVKNEAEYEGTCAFAVSTGKKNVPGDPKHSLELDGKTYYFSNPVAKFLFRLLPRQKEKADQHWNR